MAYCAGIAPYSIDAFCGSGHFNDHFQCPADLGRYRICRTYWQVNSAGLPGSISTSSKLVTLQMISFVGVGIRTGPCS